MVKTLSFPSDKPQFQRLFFTLYHWDDDLLEATIPHRIGQPFEHDMIVMSEHLVYYLASLAPKPVNEMNNEEKHTFLTFSELISMSVANTKSSTKVLIYLQETIDFELLKLGQDYRAVVHTHKNGKTINMSTFKLF